MHAILRSAWLEADAWAVGSYVLMPDHLHLFCAPRNDDVELTRWVQYWKALSTRCWGHPRTLWQRDFWDTQLRSATSYGEKLDYVRWNPVRRGLVKHPDAWPYLGEMNDLPWVVISPAAGFVAGRRCGSSALQRCLLPMVDLTRSGR